MEAAGPTRPNSRTNQSHTPAGKKQLQEELRHNSLNHEDVPAISSEAPGSPSMHTNPE